jgi:hypothetical protein
MQSSRPAHGTRPGRRQRHDVVSQPPSRRRPRLDLPPLTVRSTSSVPRREFSPHRRRCLRLAVATPLSLRTHAPTLCYIPLNVQESETASGPASARTHRSRSIPILASGGRAVTAGTAEPSTDTPVVIPPGMLSGLSGQKSQAQCMPQAASKLNPTVRHAVRGRHSEIRQSKVENCDAASQPAFNDGCR